MNRWMAIPLGAWRAVRRNPRIVLINLMGFPLLALGSWGALYLPDSSVIVVLLFLLLALVIVGLALTLVVFTFCSYYNAHHSTRAIASPGIRLPSESPVIGRSLRALPLLLGWLALFALACAGVGWMIGQALDWAKPVASWLTMVSQKPVSFYAVGAWIVWILEFLRWVFVPMLFLAFFAGISGAALSGEGSSPWLRSALRLMRNPWYWAAWICFLAVGLWLPGVLVFWVPLEGGIPAATISMAVRFALALVLLGTMWLLFLSTLARLLKQPRQNLIIFRRTLDRPA